MLNQCPGSVGTSQRQILPPGRSCLAGPEAPFTAGTALLRALTIPRNVSRGALVTDGSRVGTSLSLPRFESLGQLSWSLFSNTCVLRLTDASISLFPTVGWLLLRDRAPVRSGFFFRGRPCVLCVTTWGLLGRVMTW